MKIPQLDLRAQYASIRADVERAVGELFESQQFVLGPAVERFEREMEAYTGARHAIGVASGTDALLLGLMALGLGPGDAVITTPFTFFATAGAIARAGARIVFADIDPETFNLRPDAVEEAIAAEGKGVRRWGILPVHLYGRVVDVDEIEAIARRHGALVIEDAAQAVGARVAGRAGPAGTFGDVGALSFFPSKNLGGAGDGGMALTNDEELAARLRSLRVHGTSAHRYVHETVGINSRLDALQAVVLSVKLRHLDRWNAARRERAARYTGRLRAAGVAPRFVRPPDGAGDGHVFHQYVIRAERREELREALERAGVGTQIYYPLALHRQPCFAGLGYGEGSFPESERACRECLALPIYPELGDDAIEHVVGVMTAFYRV